MTFIEQNIQELEALSAKYAAEFSGLSAAEMDLKPDVKTWSINECLEHIILSNASFHPMLDSVAAKSYRPNAWTKIPLLPAFWGSMILKAVSPETPGKSKTFPVWMPASSSYGRNLTGELKAGNAALAEKLKGIAGVDLDRMIVSSPAGAFVTYRLRNGVTILVEHEKRHFNQAKRVKDGLAKAGVPAGKA